MRASYRRRVDDAEIAAAGLLDGLDDERARQERIELVRLLAAEGVSVEEMREAAQRQRLALLPVERVLNRGDARHSARDVAEAAGLPLDLLRRLWRALGLADLPDDEVGYTD